MDHLSSDDILPQILIHLDGITHFSLYPSLILLDGRDLGRLTQVSKQWKKIIEKNDRYFVPLFF